jgi:hypothetical protein
MFGFRTAIGHMFGAAIGLIFGAAIGILIGILGLGIG